LVALGFGLPSTGDIGIVPCYGRVPHFIRQIKGLGDVDFDSRLASLGPMGVKLIPKPLEWAIVVKGGKHISLPEYTLYFSLIRGVCGRKLTLLIGGANELSALFGMELGCVEGNNQFDSKPLPCLDVEIYNREDAMICTTLNSCSPQLSLGEPIA
jgi:hypothetical protein